MKCDVLDLGGGATAIVCSRGHRRPKPCVQCGKPSTKLCDFPLKGKKAGATCSRPICDACARNMGASDKDTIDYCPTHAAMGDPKPTPPAEVDPITLQARAEYKQARDAVIASGLGTAAEFDASARILARSYAEGEPSPEHWSRSARDVQERFEMKGRTGRR